MKNLKKPVFFLFSLLISTFVFGQDKESRNLDRFKEISVAEGIELTAKKGNENAIEIEVNGIDIEDVITEVRGGDLKIHLRREYRNRRRSVRAVLTYTEELEDVNVSTAADVVFGDVIKTDKMRIRASTSGRIRIKVSVGDLDLGATTSGRIDVEGEAENIDASVSTGGSINAYELKGSEVSASANTGGDIRVTAQDYLRGSASTGGSVRYRGNAKTDIRTNTGGSVRSGK